MTEPFPGGDAGDPGSPDPSTTSPGGHWAAVVALVLGILAVVAGLIPFVGLLALLLLGPLAIVFGIVGYLKTKDGQRAGRTMSIWGIVLGVVAIVAALVWAYLINRAIDQTFQSLYGSDRVTTGPGRNQQEAIPFGASSDYPNGLRVTAAPPSPAPVPEDLASVGGFTIGVSTTVTFENTGSDVIPFQPGAQFYYGEAGCREPERVSDNPLRDLDPGQVETVAVTAACYDEAAVPGATPSPEPSPGEDDTITLRSYPEPYDSLTWFTGAIPEGARLTD